MEGQMGCNTREENAADLAWEEEHVVMKVKVTISDEEGAVLHEVTVVGENEKSPTELANWVIDWLGNKYEFEDDE
jgi:hypothetical protein